MDNENKKNAPAAASDAGKGGKKHYHHNKKHHKGHRPQNQQKPDGVQNDAGAAAIENVKNNTQPQNSNNNKNKNKKHNDARKPQPEQAAKPTAPKEEAPKAQGKYQNRPAVRDKSRPQTELLATAPDDELDFLPARSKSESDFLSISKTDDAELDKMPPDPTLDAVFADFIPEESKEIEGPEIVGIRFEHGSKFYYFDPAGKTFRLGSHAIVETAQGLEFGEIVIANRKVPEDQIVAPLRPVIREATKEDEAHHEDNRRRQHEAFKICLTKIADHGLDMKLVDSQYTFDNTKLIFFFTSAGRVDFRALVKDLASVFRTRIELRQIGIRDEARMIGGFGVCGRKLCCAGFLPNFVQVSIKMAKEQGLSINAAKISGTCGRLMCCLRYEQDAYERELALMPPVDSFVETPDGKGTVIDLFPISGKVKVKLSGDQDIVPKIYHMSTLRILKRAEKKHSDDTEGNE